MLPSPLSAIVACAVAAASLTSQYARANPGDTVLVPPGFSYSGNITLGRSGSKGSGTDLRPDSPIIIRVGTLAADGKTIVDPPSFPAATITGQVTCNGDYNWLRGFKVGGVAFGGRTGNRLNRCLLTNNSSNQGISNTLDWCELSGMPGSFYVCRPTQGCRTPFVYRCYFHHDVGTVPGGRVFMNLGFDNSSTAIVCGAYVRDCLYADNAGPPSGVEQACEMKSSGNTIERCAAVSGGGRLRFNVRHGQRNRLLALWTDLGDMNVRGPDHLLADCVGGGGTGPASGNCTYAQWLQFVAQGKQGGKYPIGENVRIVRVHNPEIGDADAPKSPPYTNPTGTSLWHCTGTPVYDKGTPPIPPSDIHSGDPADVPVRTDSGAVRWSPSQVGPNGRWNPTDGGT